MNTDLKCVLPSITLVLNALLQCVLQFQNGELIIHELILREIILIIISLFFKACARTMKTLIFVNANDRCYRYALSSIASHTRLGIEPAILDL